MVHEVQRPHAMLAGELLADLSLPDGAWRHLPLSGLALDSRALARGGLFLACGGSRAHGLDYLDQALARGAALVLAEPTESWSAARIAALAESTPVPVLAVEDLSRRASGIAARFYGEPGRRLRLMGVTGTNGKTSVAWSLAHALPQEWACAVTGTLGNGFPGALAPATHTTPDAVQAQRILAELAAAGARTLAMEVSSHALDQHRLAALDFHTAVFTNLTRDHLDYHGTLHAYARAKRRLFEWPGLETAVLNADDDLGAGLAEELAGRVERVVCHRRRAKPAGDRFIRLAGLESSDQGLRLALETSWGAAELRTPLLGEFNATNLMLVLGVMLAWDIPLETAVARLSRVPGVPGRMQRFGGGERPLVVVDYAHTPDALQRALTSLRPHTRGRLWCLFGCGGERDRGKRPIMGQVAEALADRVIVTDDNPRREPSATIIADILEGMNEPRRALVLPDRAFAIATALVEAAPGDTVLIAGKGHETWQEVGDLRLPFSDVGQVERWLEGDA